MRIFLCLFVVAGCRGDEPAWSRIAGRALGDETISGTPVKIPKLTPKLDGKLDEWNAAATLGPFVDTFNGKPEEKHPVASFARAAWDDRALYVAFVVRDRSPSSPFGRDDVDPHIWAKASGVEVMLQPGDPGDNREYYELQVDVGGAVFDTRWDDYMNPVTGTGDDKRFGHMDWSSRVERAIETQAGRFWSVELALPWAAFSSSRVSVPPKPGDVWRMNLYAFRDGQRLALGWSPLRGQGNFHKSARWGRVQF
jgi:hypothetical protein